MATEDYAFGFRGTRLSDYRVGDVLVAREVNASGVKTACYAAHHIEKDMACMISVVYNENEPTTLSLGDAVGNEYSFCSGTRVPPHPGVMRAVHSFIDASTGITLPSTRMVSDWERVLFVVHERVGAPLDVDKRYSQGEVVAVGAQLAGALVHLKTHGVAHRSLAHGSVFMDDAGRVALAGFAGALDLREQHKHHNTLSQNHWEVPYTSPHQFLGIPATLPPECAKLTPGRGAVVNYENVDTYALGLVLHRMLSGLPYPYEHGVAYASEGSYQSVGVPCGRLEDVIKGLLKPNAGDRWTIERASSELTVLACQGYAKASRHALQWEGLAKEVDDAKATAADATADAAKIAKEKAVLESKLADAEWQLADIGPLNAEVERLTNDLSHAQAELAAVTKNNKAMSALIEDGKLRLQGLEARLAAMAAAKKDVDEARAADTIAFNIRIDALKSLLAQVQDDSRGQIQGLMAQNAKLFAAVKAPEPKRPEPVRTPLPFDTDGDGGDDNLAGGVDSDYEGLLGTGSPTLGGRTSASPQRKGLFGDGGDDDDDFSTSSGEAAAAPQRPSSPSPPPELRPYDPTDSPDAPPVLLGSPEGAAAAAAMPAPLDDPALSPAPPPAVLRMEGGHTAENACGSPASPPASRPAAGAADVDSDDDDDNDASAQGDVVQQIEGAARELAALLQGGGDSDSDSSAPPVRAKPAAKKAVGKRGGGARVGAFDDSSSDSSSAGALKALPQRASPSHGRRLPGGGGGGGTRRGSSSSSSSSSASSASRTAPPALAQQQNTVRVTREVVDEKLGLTLQSRNNVLELTGVVADKAGGRCGLSAYVGMIVARVDGTALRTIPDLVRASESKMAMEFEFRKKTLTDDVSSSSSSEDGGVVVHGAAAPLGGTLVAAGAGSDSDSDSSSMIEQPKPPSQARPKPAAKKPAAKKKASAFASSDSSSSEAPVRKPAAKAVRKPPPSDSSSSDSEFMPAVARRKPAAKKPAAKKPTSDNLFGDSSSD